MLEDLLGILDFFKRSRSHISDQEKKIIRDGVLYALNSTKNWIASNGMETQQSSQVISNIWRRTSVELREIKSQEVYHLADLLETKSKHWTGYDLVKEDISFKNIENLIKSL
jgi:hypothetical protein